MQVRKGDIVKKKKLMALLYILILLILIFTIYLEVKEFKNKPTKTVDELINEEINERYNNDKVDYYTFDEVNEQKYLDSSEDNKSTEKKEIVEQKGNNKSDKVIEPQSDKTSASNNNKPVETPTNIIEPENNKPEEQVINETIGEQPKEEIIEDNSVDTNSMDYRIHKGRIDCNNAEACMDISIPIQLKYKKSISNVNYIEVIAKSDKTLGYFIDYVFVEYNYGNIDKCNEIGSSIKTKLSDRVTGFTCSPEGILKINKDY